MGLLEENLMILKKKKCMRNFLLERVASKLLVLKELSEEIAAIAMAGIFGCFMIYRADSQL